MKRLILITLIPLCVWALACGGAVEEQTAPADADVLHVSLIANEGYLLTSGDDKVLIDALFREGVEGYGTLPFESREMVETAEPPFDTVDYVLATHIHADHFHPLAVCRYLSMNPLAEFISTRQAYDQMAKNCDSSDASAMASRVKIGINDDGTSTPISMDDFVVESIRLHHGETSSIDNYGFRIQIGGRTIVHLGDTQVSVDEMRAAGMGDKPVDIAFVPYWYLITDRWIPAITEVINPRVIVVMHLPPEGSPHLEAYQGWEPLVGTILHRFPNATVFKEPFETQSF